MIKLAEYEEVPGYKKNIWVRRNARTATITACNNTLFLLPLNEGNLNILVRLKKQLRYSSTYMQRELWIPNSDNEIEAILNMFLKAECSNLKKVYYKTREDLFGALLAEAI